MRTHSAIKYDEFEGKPFGFFNAFMQGHQVWMYNNIYSRRMSNLPSQCGGRSIEIRPIAFSVEEECVTPGGHLTDYPMTDVLPCGESGLLVVSALLPGGCYPNEFKQSIEQWCEELMENDPGFHAAANFPEYGYIDIASDVPNHRWYMAIVTVANVDMHDDEEGNAPDDFECEECGGVVYSCDDYYCEECDWYTRPFQTDPPFEDYELGLVLDSVENYNERFTHDNLMSEARSSLGYDADGLFWAWQDESVTDRVDSIVHARTRDSDDRPGNFHIGEFTAMLGPRVMRAPIVVSSNIAEAPYMTPELMAYIIRHKNWLRDHGIGVLHTGYCATNPNERNHYIDGLVLYPQSRTTIRRQALPL